MLIPYIYKITNLVNQKAYVGATKRSPEQRLAEHFQNAKRIQDRPLYEAINEFGKENFVLAILEECEEHLLEERERYWIEKLRTFKYGYNATVGGGGKRYADYDLILSLWNKGKNVKEIHEVTAYDVKTIRTALDSHGVLPYERKKRGYNTCEHSVAKLVAGTNQIVEIFPSIQAACSNIGKQHSGHIASVCEGKRKTAYGYGWKYLSA